MKQRMMEVVVTTGLLELKAVQSSSHIITTNKPTSSFFTGRMPFLSPNQQCQSTEGKISHSMDLLTLSSPGGLPTLSLTIYSSWLTWERFAIPLISSLMPVPSTTTTTTTSRITTTTTTTITAAATTTTVRDHFRFGWVLQRSL